MSCFLMNAESIAAITDYIVSVHRGGFSFAGFEAPRSLKEELKDCDDPQIVYSRLAHLNVSAYCCRYPYEDGVIMELYRPNTKHSRAEWSQLETDHHAHFVVRPWHYAMLKRIDCFIYQCSEDVNKHNKLLKAMCDFRHALAEFMIANNNKYVNSVWG